MIVVMKPQATEQELTLVIDRISSAGLQVHLSKGSIRTIIGIIGDKKVIAELPVQVMAGVEKVVPITVGYKLVSREFRPENSIIKVNGFDIGGDRLAVMAGPCAVESREQLLEAAQIVKQCGAQFLRGGAYKPRTSPYSFQGLEEKGLQLLAEARELTGLSIVTEVVDSYSVPIVSDYADVLQIGARNMQNYQLLKAVGKTKKPILLKRGMSATLDEWLHAAEYILSEGNDQVIFCERGIRTFETHTRNTLDLSAVAALKILSHLPVIVDPSHGTGVRNLVAPMAKAAVAAGADGLIIEVHPNPSQALSDGAQSLDREGFGKLMSDLSRIALAMDRKL
jgi:3-deoxy-7-phosphoheptulonate synthase